MNIYLNHEEILALEDWFDCCIQFEIDSLTTIESASEKVRIEKNIRGWKSLKKKLRRGKRGKGK